MFPSRTGDYLANRNFTRRHFRPMLRGAGIPDEAFTLYSLRHTCATLMLASNVSIRIVSERLGHDDMTTTLKHYAHALPGQQGIAAKAAEKLFY